MSNSTMHFINTSSPEFYFQKLNQSFAFKQTQHPSTYKQIGNSKSEIWGIWLGKVAGQLLAKEKKPHKSKKLN